MLALIKDAAIVQTVVEGSGFAIGEAWTVPAYAGWANSEGYSLATVLDPDPVPEGKVVASSSVELVGGAPKWVNVLADKVEPVPDVISDRQFFQRLAMPPYELITQAEALAAVKTGDIPYAMINLINALPEASRFPAEMLLSGATEFKRDHPLTATLGMAFGWDAPEVDQFWRDAAAI
ncbi:hypothetical protein [Mesorhizobium sp. M2A.F.Ca.ET.039.01.1.1]|uniref:hypothetical protein n=1 Tax=Mesorhizobium sp. M2A.F.Ca.ET.039.01.1.1 TaxID=2496746 RepID=UPI000FCA519C|nr:hypothetical protein [Mesorhizobium sp. M2A.F.Ca.ET.039.01.1.1]RWX72603.1 hypothetical protein EOA24_00015 [Mesorhizobium sp. M2A.F.Ca.ET.039.01.1.1]